MYVGASKAVACHVRIYDNYGYGYTYGYYYVYSILRLLAAFPNRVINSPYTYEYSLEKKNIFSKIVLVDDFFSFARVMVVVKFCTKISTNNFI